MDSKTPGSRDIMNRHVECLIEVIAPMIEEKESFAGVSTKEVKSQIVYAIGKKCENNVFEFEMWYGPDPSLRKMLEQKGTCNHDYIICFYPEQTNKFLYQWRVDKWIRIDF